MLKRILACLPLARFFRLRVVCCRCHSVVVSRSFLNACAHVPSCDPWFLMLTEPMSCRGPCLWPRQATSSSTANRPRAHSPSPTRSPTSPVLLSSAAAIGLGAVAPRHYHVRLPLSCGALHRQAPTAAPLPPPSQHCLPLLRRRGALVQMHHHHRYVCAAPPPSFVGVRSTRHPPPQRALRRCDNPPPCWRCPVVHRRRWRGGVTSQQSLSEIGAQIWASMARSIGGGAPRSQRWSKPATCDARRSRNDDGGNPRKDSGDGSQRRVCRWQRWSLVT